MKYYVQIIAENYLKNFAVLPDTITIHPCYLQGLTADSFEKGFRALHAYVEKIYADIAADPSAYGVPLIEAVENPQKNDYSKSSRGFNRVPNLLYALGAVGKLKNDLTLEISGDELDEAVKNLKITKAAAVLDAFVRHGLSADGYDKKIRKGDKYVVSYPACHKFAAALKSMAEARQKCRSSDLEYFSLMQPELLEKENIKKVKYDFNAIRRALGDKRRMAETLHMCVLTDANSKINSSISGVGSNSWSCTYTSSVNKRMLMTISTSQNDLNVKLNLENIGNYMENVMLMPHNFREKIRTNGWSCNTENCNPKCIGGYRFKMDNIEYNKCRGGAFMFHDVTEDELPYLSTLLGCETHARLYNYENGEQNDD